MVMMVVSLRKGYPEEAYGFTVAATNVEEDQEGINKKYVYRAQLVVVLEQIQVIAAEVARLFSEGWLWWLY